MIDSSKRKGNYVLVLRNSFYLVSSIFVSVKIEYDTPLIQNNTHIYTIFILKNILISLQYKVNMNYYIVYK